MTVWSKPAHQFAQSSHEDLPGDFKFGIDLTLGQLIETKTQPIIQWLAPESRVKTNRVGGFRSRFKGRGMDFDEVRLYQIGDDIRNIDWKVTARTGDAHTKLFKEERERPVFVVLDHMPSMFFGTRSVFKSILASKIAAQLMWNTLTNGDRFGTLIFSNDHHVEMKPSSNRRNCMRLLNRVVESHQQTLSRTFADDTRIESTPDKTTENDADSGNPFADTLKRLQFLAKPGTLIHLVSDFYLFDEKCQRHLSKLSQHADVHCILIHDPIEQALPPAGLYGITDGVSDGLLDTSNGQLQKEYQQNFIQKVEQIKDFSLSHKGVFTLIDTDFKQYSIGHHSASGGINSSTGGQQ
ncbi:DUF58 domain-containing protein [Aliikangiella sp. G2MR2-5]|uniref:DUF58 domain-containing protein n=1 Tax=Aliikangiella sp. G2MR2-5 TaxID=2788943 RepID=UPI0018A9C516|nr:DUF58 domain-containing protein [Aliikangiella sp. G2MR2-5]